MSKKWIYVIGAVAVIVMVLGLMHMSANGMLPSIRIPNPHGG